MFPQASHCVPCAFESQELGILASEVHSAQRQSHQLRASLLVLRLYVCVCGWVVCVCVCVGVGVVNCGVHLELNFRNRVNIVACTEDVCVHSIVVY